MRIRDTPYPQVVLATTASTRGGVWRHIEDLGLGLEQAGWPVTIALLPSASDLHQAARRARLTWEPMHVTLLRPQAIWHVHLHDTFDKAAFAGVVLRRRSGPTIITEHLPRTNASDAELESQFRRRPGAATAKTWFKRVEVRMSDRLIAVGTSSAKFLQERYAIPASAISIVQNGIRPVADLSRANQLDGTLRVLALGHRGRQKGLDVLLEALALSQGSWHLTVAGPGLEHAIGLDPSRVPPGRADFLGWVDDPERLVESSHVVCMPSRWESFPYSALEALARARPVVASNVDGLDEILEDEVSGLLVEPSNPSQLAAALDRLSADRGLLARLSSGASQRASAFPFERMISGTIDAYMTAMASKQRHAATSADETRGGR